ncbi:hypothetical protein HYE59_08535 [Aggregatibacter actinomycetemcomitans]|uniref:hypothetical protein n=1 Tax=Aggregatibacter actinomycetemcomitans TaxID=714 RepID=UPI00197C5147|nr:hypothetical protein [Aggregatibacter actinomycetemcomitans]MBN6077574.1 hypothetical protein [Aggregatibacter actinomycetemcomitans]
MDLNQPMDYSKLNPIKLKAISISHQNTGKQHGAFNSSFPYTTEAILVLAEQFTAYPAEHIGGLKIFHDELLTINKHLLQMAPKPPSLVPEEAAAMLSNDELIDGLLKHSLVNSLVNTFSYFQEIVAMRINMIENGALEGEDYGKIN